MKIGKRLFYNKKTGNIKFVENEMDGDITERTSIELDYIDLPYGYDENKFRQSESYHIDVTKDKNTTDLKDLIIIDKYKEHIETEEEKLKREKQELENQLLLAENNNIEGGIL